MSTLQPIVVPDPEEGIPVQPQPVARTVYRVHQRGDITKGPYQRDRKPPGLTGKADYHRPCPEADGIWMNHNDDRLFGFECRADFDRWFRDECIDWKAGDYVLSHIVVRADAVEYGRCQCVFEPQHAIIVEEETL